MPSRDRSVDVERGPKHGSSSRPTLNIEDVTSAKQDLLTNLCIQYRYDNLGFQEKQGCPAQRGQYQNASF